MKNLYYYFLLFASLQVSLCVRQRLVCSNPITCRVVSSKVLDFMPLLGLSLNCENPYLLFQLSTPFLLSPELHHVVFLSASSKTHMGVFAVDFTPLDQSNLATISSLLRGKWVSGEIRIRYMADASIQNMKRLKDKWSCLTCVGLQEQTDEPDSVPLEVKLNEDLVQLYNIVSKLKRSYTHNCQHFSEFVKTLCAEHKVCSWTSDC
jgi:hypothetical protein